MVTLGVICTHFVLLLACMQYYGIEYSNNFMGHLSFSATGYYTYVTTCYDIM